MLPTVSATRATPIINLYYLTLFDTPLQLQKAGLINGWSASTWQMLLH